MDANCTGNVWGGDCVSNCTRGCTVNCSYCDGHGGPTEPPETEEPDPPVNPPSGCGTCSGNCASGCNSCGGCSNNGCMGGCRGGCKEECDTTCRDYCDNGCSSQNASTEYKNLKLKLNNVIFKDDLNDIIKYVIKEMKRRRINTTSTSVQTKQVINSSVYDYMVNDLKKYNYKVNQINDNIVLKEDYINICKYLESIYTERGMDYTPKS